MTKPSVCEKQIRWSIEKSFKFESDVEKEEEKEIPSVNNLRSAETHRGELHFRAFIQTTWWS